MSTLSITRSYNDGEVLVEADLDNICDDVETFVNTTKISDDNIQDSGITGSTKLLNQSVTAAKLGSASVTTAKIDDLAVTAAKLAADSVTTAKILDANVTVAKLATDSVTTVKIVDSNVTTAKINDSAVTTAKINDSAVTTAKINDSAVTTAKINNSAVTGAKLSTRYLTATIATDTSWTNGEVKTIGSITTVGRLVRVTLLSGLIYADDASAGVYDNIDLQYSSDNASWSTVGTIYRAWTSDSFVGGAGYIGYNALSSNDTQLAVHPHTNSTLPAVLVHTPSAGTAYYRLVRTQQYVSTLKINTAITVLVEEL